MIQKPKGTYDVYGDKGKSILYLEKLLPPLMEKYNYEYIRTPLFESSELFHRGVGETTDIVSKETYDFVDRGNRNMTLRPEGTAGAVRSYIENKLYARDTIPVKNWYYGPMYRYERPQSGRFREFYQFGIEVFGSSDPLVDAEVIGVAVDFYKALGIGDIKVNINSLGDKQSRDNYHEALKKYFEPHLKDMCEDCQKRFEKNPLRILDCKKDADSEIMKSAPKITDYLNEPSKKHFELVQEYLTAIKVNYKVNPRIVRGLDYYTHTVFEVYANIDGFGSQNVIGAGGRYDNLVENIGGIKSPGVGFAAGIERILDIKEKQGFRLSSPNNLDCYVVYIDEEQKAFAIKMLQEIRKGGYLADMDFMSRSLKSNFKQAEKLNSRFMVIIGEDEMEKQIVTLRNTILREEYKIKADELVRFLNESC